MKQIMIAGVLGLVLFSASAGGVYFVQQSGKGSDDEGETGESGDKSADAGTNNSDGKSKLNPTSLDTSTSLTSKTPLAVRTDQELSVEALLEMNDSVIRAEKELQRRQEKIRTDESRVKLLFEDLKREREELLAYEDRINSRIDEANLLISKIDEKRQELSKVEEEVQSKRDEFRKDVLEIDSDKAEQAKELSSLLKNLKDKAPQLVQDKANAGEMKEVAQALNNLRDRDKAKILEGITDDGLVQQLIDMMTKLKVKKE